MYKKILVPVDGSETSRRGLQEAIGLALVDGSTLRLLHVLDDYPLLLESAAAPTAFEPVRREMRAQGEALLNEALAATQQAGVQAKTVLREGAALRVAQAIVHESTEAGCDLIVMGTHGRRGIDRLVVGSDAEAVIRTSNVPVLLVKATATQS